jgi:hypothetical protein
METILPGNVAVSGRFRSVVLAIALLGAPSKGCSYFDLHGCYRRGALARVGRTDREEDAHLIRTSHLLSHSLGFSFFLLS